MYNKLKLLFSFAFIFELILFSLTLFFAIGIALSLMLKPQAQEQIIAAQPHDISLLYFLSLFIIATAILYVIIKYFKKPWLIQGLFYLAIIEGLMIFCQAYFPYPNYLYILVLIILFWLIYRNVLVHDLVIILAISAISVIFGLNLLPSSTILILLFLAIYDFWAVYKTKHMVKMFRGLAEAKVHFAIIIPDKIKKLFTKLKEVSPASGFMFLGTGDLALPAIFVVSTLKINLQTSLLTALGAICGLILLYVIFITQKQRQPMPGLPPIILGCLVGFLIALLI